jgi:hypothetical protein
MGLPNFQSQSTLAFKFAMHTKEEEKRRKRNSSKFRLVFPEENTKKTKMPQIIYS